MTHESAMLALEVELMAWRRRARAANREFARAVHPRLDPTAYPLVVTLALGSAHRVLELAAVLSLDKSTVSRQISAVAKLGLVERRPDPDDARARLVDLTAEGKAIVTAQLAQRRKQMWQKMSSWDDADVAELVRLLHKLGETKLV